MSHKLMLTKDLNPEEKDFYFRSIQAAKRDPRRAILLALFLGSFGAHHFYLGKYRVGLLYLAFCWSLFPMVLSWGECLMLRNQVKNYNRRLSRNLMEKIAEAREEMFHLQQYRAS